MVMSLKEGTFLMEPNTSKKSTTSWNYSLSCYGLDLIVGEKVVSNRVSYYGHDLIIGEKVVLPG